MTHFNWNEYAFKSKKEIKQLKPVFIVAPRQISKKRFIQLFKKYATHNNVLFGIAKEPFIKGFENQPQFKALQFSDIQEITEKIEKSPATNRLHFLYYMQSDLPHILEKLLFTQVALIHASWHKVFHTRPEFFQLIKHNITYEFLSPFVDEKEAIEYESNIKKEMLSPLEKFIYGYEFKTEDEIFEVVKLAASQSFDNSFQIGAVLVDSKNPDKKTLIDYAHNKIVPFETYAMLNGYQREIHMSSPNDTNHYDTNHAEVELITKLIGRSYQSLQERSIRDTKIPHEVNRYKSNINMPSFHGYNTRMSSLSELTLYINVLPCPTCARMLCSTPIQTIKYKIDHSEGYAYDLLKKAGKNVVRV